LLYGATTALGGTLQMAGGPPQRVDAQKPARAISQGMVLIPGDRQNNAVIGTLSVAENLGMPVYDRATHPWASRT